VTAAIFGLLGVIVGGMLNGLIAWRLERDRDRVTSRAAARLVMAELDDADSQADFGLGIGDLADWGRPLLSDKAWRGNSAQLARTLDDETWRFVVASYELMDLARPFLEGRGSSFKPADRMLSDIREVIAVARPGLARHASQKAAQPPQKHPRDSTNAGVGESSHPHSAGPS
jgi:hypothetical protein